MQRIRNFVRIINTTDKFTIINGWEKTRLTEGIDSDDIIFEEPDNEKVLLQNAMEELMLESDTESLPEDLEAKTIVLVPKECQNEQNKKTSSC